LLFQGCPAPCAASAAVVAAAAIEPKSLVSYALQAWQLQKELVDEVCSLSSSSSSSSCSGSSSSRQRGSSNGSNRPSSSGGNGSPAAAAASSSTGGAPPIGALLLLQHPPVYTLGAGATEQHLRFDPDAPPHPMYRIERGGEVRGLLSEGC